MEIDKSSAELLSHIGPNSLNRALLPQRWRCESVWGQKFLPFTKRGKKHVSGQDFNLQGLRWGIYLYSRRTGILRWEGLSERAAEMQSVPRFEKKLFQTGERTVHNNLRKLWKRSKSSFPAFQWQTGILQRVLCSDEAAVIHCLSILIHNIFQ